MVVYLKVVSVLLASVYAAKASDDRISSEVDRLGLFKNVRTIIGSGNNSNLRKLQGTLTTKCFTYCIEESLTPDECMAYIEDQIVAANGHEVGPVTVKIQIPRPTESLADTYWMMEVPVNVYGQMACDRNGGDTSPYRFMWMNGGDGVAVPPISCQGLSAGQCCVRVREAGQTLGKDENSNCLACFAHQEPLIPAVGAGGMTQYGDYVWDGSSCNEVSLTPDEVSVSDDATGVAIVNAANSLSHFEEAPTCTDFSSLLEALYDAAVVVPSLPQYIGRLACDFCYDDAPINVTPELSDLISTILGLLSPTPEFDSTENCIIIYTKDDGTIAEVPKLGGSRAEDPFDDDCPPDGSEGVEGGGVGGANPADGGDGISPNDGGGSPVDGEDGAGGDEGNEIDQGYGNSAPLCYIPASTAPLTPLGTYSAPTESCSASSELKSGLPYSIELTNHIVADDGSSTRFIYNVCTAPRNCEGRRLQGGGGVKFRADAAISHFQIGILGSCTVTDFAMFDLNGESEGGDFPESAAYAIGNDPTTCVPGFKFDSGWDSVADSGCVTEDWCRDMMVEVSGIVPTGNGEGAVKASTGYTLISGLSVPDCGNACA